MKPTFQSVNLDTQGNGATRKSHVVHRKHNPTTMMRGVFAYSPERDQSNEFQLWNEKTSKRATEEGRGNNIDKILIWGNEHLSKNLHWGSDVLLSFGKLTFLGKNETLVNQNEKYYVVSVESGEVFRDIYLGTVRYDDENVSTNGDKAVFHALKNLGEISDSESLIFRKISRRADIDQYTNSEEQLIIKPRDYKSCLRAHYVLETVDEPSHKKSKKGELFFVYDDKSRLVTFGNYLGYHVDDDRKPVFWFDNGACIPLDQELLFVEAKKRTTVIPSLPQIKQTLPSDPKSLVKPTPLQQEFLDLANKDGSLFYLSGQNLSNAAPIKDGFPVYILDIDKGDVIGPVYYLGKNSGKPSYYDGPRREEITDSNGLLIRKMSGDLKEEYTVDESQNPVNIKFSDIQSWKEPLLSKKDQLFSFEAGSRSFFGRPRFVKEVNDGVVIGLDSGEIVKLNERGSIKVVPYKKKTMQFGAVPPRKPTLDLAPLNSVIDKLDDQGEGFTSEANSKLILENAIRENASVYQNGHLISGKHLQPEERISCIRASNGICVVLAGSYLGKKGNAQWVYDLITREQKELLSINGIVFRRIKYLDKLRYQKEDSNSVILEASQSIANLKKIKQILERGLDEKYEINLGQIPVISNIVGYNFIYRDGNVAAMLLWLGNGKFTIVGDRDVAITPVTISNP